MYISEKSIGNNTIGHAMSIYLHFKTFSIQMPRMAKKKREGLEKG